MPLDAKIPFKNWRNTIFYKEQLHSHKDNIGWNIGIGDLVVDVDPRNFKNGIDDFEQLQKDLGIALTPTVNTPNGGFHCYLKIPELYVDYKFKKKIKKYPGIDFLTEGSYCLIVDCKTKIGSYIWSDDIFGSFEQKLAPMEIVNLIGRSPNSDVGLGDFDGLISYNSNPLPVHKVLEMLSKLDPSMGHDEWVKVGMALHNWDPIEGLEIWENWSKQGENYEPYQTESKWKSFSGNGGITLGTISYMVKEVVFDEALDKVNDYLNKIKKSDEKQLEFDVFPKIKKETFSKIHLERLAKGIQDRFKEISNVKMPISNVRSLIISEDVSSGVFVNDTELPEWCKDWVYVNTHSSFVSLSSLKLMKTEAFNITNGKYVPESQNGSKQSASKYISDKGYVESVDSMAYLPNFHESLCVIDDYKVLNIFNPKTVPKAASEYTDEGLEAIKIIKRHINFICSSDKNAHIFTQWLAHCVQFPGKQILWSPVIQSIQGVGKSFFGELLRSCLGDRNVGTVSPTQVVSDFNGWATNVMVNVLEELRVKGHNRYDAVNSLKPLITDRMIQINDKGVKQYMTYNTTNYICFTNYKDSLPLNEDDRRWWVIFVPVDSLEEMEKVIGESIKTYFPKLFDSVRNNGHIIRKWLLDFPLTVEFLNTKQAPMTEHKLGMIATEEAGVEGLMEIKDLINRGGEFFNDNVISSSDLFDQVIFEHPELQIIGRSRHVILKKLGYSALPKPMKLNGKTRRMWAKKSLTSEEVKEMLKLSQL